MNRDANEMSSFNVRLSVQPQSSSSPTPGAGTDSMSSPTSRKKSFPSVVIAAGEGGGHSTHLQQQPSSRPGSSAQLTVPNHRGVSVAETEFTSDTGHILVLEEEATTQYISEASTSDSPKSHACGGGGEAEGTPYNLTPHKIPLLGGGAKHKKYSTDSKTGTAATQTGTNGLDGCDRISNLSGSRAEGLDVEEGYQEQLDPTMAPKKVKSKSRAAQDKVPSSGPPKESMESKKERKAAKTLAIITGVFVICWVPFFIVALMMPLCGESCDRNIPEWVFSVFLWLGYFNSTLNPIIYTIFSPDFKQAFNKILGRGLRGGQASGRGAGKHGGSQQLKNAARIMRIQAASGGGVGGVAGNSDAENRSCSPKPVNV